VTCITNNKNKDCSKGTRTAAKMAGKATMFVIVGVAIIVLLLVSITVGKYLFFYKYRKL